MQQSSAARTMIVRDFSYPQRVNHDTVRNGNNGITLFSRTDTK